VIVKPDGVQRGLIGEVIKRYERTGLKLIGLKLVLPTGDLIEKHYLVDPDWKVKRGEKTIQAYKDKGLEAPITDPEKSGQATLDVLKKYFASGPVVATVWQGMNAVAVVKKITGGTEPLTSDVGTIRGDLTTDSFQVADVDGRSVRNIVHVSGALEDALGEIPLWFSENELYNYRLINESIIYDVNLDGILE